MTNFTWTDEIIANAESQWLAGRSAAEIAREIGPGITRSAVCGKMRRLGLSRDPTATHARTRERTREARQRRFRKERPLLCIAAELASPEPPPVDLPLSEPVTLLALTSHTCRWPVSGEGEPFMFCAAQSLEGRSYCGFHHALGTQKPR